MIRFITMGILWNDTRHINWYINQSFETKSIHETCNDCELVRRLIWLSMASHTCGEYGPPRVVCHGAYNEAHSISMNEYDKCVRKVRKVRMINAARK